MQIVTRDYQGHAIAYQDDGWFNATQAAAKFSKRVDHWLANQDTKDYVAAILRRDSNTRLSGYLKTKRGASGGTWLHPRLAVAFARWLDVDFAVWCDEQIDLLIRGKVDWRKERNQCAATYKVMSEMLRLTRADDGKVTAAQHYCNEARLINSILAGEFKGLDRDALSVDDLALLTHLEERNAVLIGRGFAYDQRKSALRSYAMDWRMARTPMLADTAKA